VPGAQFFPDLPGPEHPRASHREPLDTQLAERNVSLPGFGPFGTAGQHLFDQDSPSYVRIAAMCAIRSAHPVLRIGRQYPRQIKLPHTDSFFLPPVRLLPGREFSRPGGRGGCKTRTATMPAAAMLSSPPNSPVQALTTWSSPTPRKRQRAQTGTREAILSAKGSP
jgi:hypothetical protein